MSRDGFYILVDDREGKVIPHMHDLSDPDESSKFPITPFFVERLTVGDYAIMYRGSILAVIERKSWSDMAASIKDGRKRNVEKLLVARQSTSCTIVYLIEGKAFPNPKSKIGGIQYKSMQAHLDHLMFRDNISMIQTANTQHTARRLFEMVENMRTLDITKKIDDLKVKGGEVNDVKGNVGELKIAHKKTPDVILLEIWESMSWITTKTATLLIEKTTIKQFMLGRISINELASMRYPSGAIIGTIRAKKMLKIRSPTSVAQHIKLFNSVPMIGKQTAEKIINNHSINEWLEMDTETARLTLENLRSGDKRLINKTGVANIIRYILT